MRLMSFAEPMWDQNFHMLPKYLFSLIPEQLLGLGVDEYYPARLIHHYHCIWSGLQQILGASFLQSLALGDVVDDANEVRCKTVGVVQRSYRYLTVLLARGVHRLFFPSHGLTGSNRLSITV